MWEDCEAENGAMILLFQLQERWEFFPGFTIINALGLYKTSLHEQECIDELENSTEEDENNTEEEDGNGTEDNENSTEQDENIDPDEENDTNEETEAGEEDSDSETVIINLGRWK